MIIAIHKLVLSNLLMSQVGVMHSSFSFSLFKQFLSKSYEFLFCRLFILSELLTFISELK